jgi:hypothetical protein
MGGTGGIGFGNWTGLPWIAAHLVVYPALEVVHIVGISLLLGSLVLLELRVWGRGAELPLRPFARLALRVTVTGFGAIVCSGLVMFAAHPGEMLANRAFVIKIALVHLAAVNAVWFHGRDSLARCDALARAQTVASTGLWVAAIIAGRWIAYV